MTNKVIMTDTFTNMDNREAYRFEIEYARTEKKLKLTVVNLPDHYWFLTPEGKDVNDLGSISKLNLENLFDILRDYDYEELIELVKEDY